MDITVWVELVIFVALMALSAFFSSSETALFSLDKMQVDQLRRDGNPRVGLIERLLSEPRRLIVTILIGNEFVNVAASVISAAIVIELLGAEDKFINLFIMVPILLLFGEITPKTLAIRNNAAFASFQSVIIDWFARFIAPVRWAVRLVADWLTTLLVGKERARGSIVTPDMVRTLAYEAVGDGVLDDDEAHYIDQIFDFGNKTLADVMTPRSNVFFLPAEMPLPQMVAEIQRTRRTKVPIYQGHRDNIVGILYARDLLGVNLRRIADKPELLLKLLREPYFVPVSKPAAELFHSFRKRKLSVALTVDEYGGVTGLVSMEDLLECIFGEIPSPSDAGGQLELQVLADGRTRIHAAMPVEQFNERLGAELPTDTAETIGGLVLHAYGELPPVGAKVQIGELELEVVAVERNRVKEITVTRAQISAEATLPAAESVPGDSAPQKAQEEAGDTGPAEV
jgi:putative hemolysin